MITKVVIRDNEKTPISYLPKLKNFENGKVYEFKEGVNVIVGENGCGKSTLLNLIRAYLLVDQTECSKGMYNNRINKLFRTYKNETILDGVDVYADYTRNTFRLCHLDEKTGDDVLKDHQAFGEFFEQNNSSTGESVVIAINSLLNYIFGKKVKLSFDYHKQFEELYPSYVDYVNSHRVECGKEWTILMDEPDRNLSLENIEPVQDMLSFHKPNIQLIAIVHNPLIIYSLSKNKEVNFIEMSKDYVNKVITTVDKLIK